MLFWEINLVFESIENISYRVSQVFNKNDPWGLLLYIKLQRMSVYIDFLV